MKKKKSKTSDLFPPSSYRWFLKPFCKIFLSKRILQITLIFSLNNLLYELLNIINTFLIPPLTDLFQVADTGKDKWMETMLIRAEIIFRSEIRVTLCVITLPTFLIFFNTSSCHVCTVTPFLLLPWRSASTFPAETNLQSFLQNKSRLWDVFVSVKLCLDHLTKNSKTILYTQCIIQHICYDSYIYIYKSIYIIVCLNWPQVKLRSTETISLTASYSFFFWHV